MNTQIKDIIWIASIDIGKKNFCFLIEEINIKRLENIKNISYPERYNENGTFSPNMTKIINEVIQCGKVILHCNTDLTIDTDKTQYLDKEIYYNMTDHLDKYVEYFDKCSIIMVEQQLKRNSMAMKLAQHCYSYFAIRYGRFKPIIEFPSYYKTQILGAEKTKGRQYKNGKYKWKTLDAKERKKWAVKKSIDVLTERKDEINCNNIKGRRKADDLADTLLMSISFTYLHFVDKKL